MRDQELLFSTVTALIQTQMKEDELTLIRRWMSFIGHLRRLTAPLNEYDWGRNLRLQLGFIYARLRCEERKRLFSGQPHLAPGDVSYTCDSLRCRLESMRGEGGVDSPRL